MNGWPSNASPSWSIKSASRQASSRMRSSSGRSSYFLGSAISRHNFDPDFLGPRGFVGLRFVVVVSDMSPPPGWLHCPGASPERENLDKKRTQMHRCYGFSALWRARGLPPTPIGANGFGPSEQVGSPSWHRAVALPANR